MLLFLKGALSKCKAWELAQQFLGQDLVQLRYKGFRAQGPEGRSSYCSKRSFDILASMLVPRVRDLRTQREVTFLMQWLGAELDMSNIR